MFDRWNSFIGATSWIYAVVAALAGAYFLLRAHRLHAGVVAP